MAASSSTASQRRQQEGSARGGSLTITAGGEGLDRPQSVLRLRGASEEESDGDRTDSNMDGGRGRRRRIRWAEDVVDNEGLGRKSSKVCCIYHAPRPIDESSDESESDSDDSSSDEEEDRARPTNNKGKGRAHEHGNDCGHGHGKGKDRKRSPNAYERQPAKGKSTS